MATFGVSANSDGTLTCSVGSDIYYSVTITNSTTGVVIYSTSANPGGRGSYSVGDSSPNPQTTNSYSCVFRNSSGGVVGSLSGSGTPTWSKSSSPGSSGPYAGVSSWSLSNGNSAAVFLGADIYVNGSIGSSGNGLSGGSNYPTYVGYSTSYTSFTLWRFQNSYGGANFSISTVAAGGTTGAAPPPAPNPPTNLTVTSDDFVNNVSLSWTSSGATGYNVYRTLPGGSITYMGSTAGTTWTDNAAGSARPIIYQILAYNSGPGGTTNAGSYATVYTLAHVNSSVQPLWNVNIMTTQTKNIQWIDFNARLTPNAILIASGVSGVLSDIQDDPSNPDANSLVGSGPVDVRLAFTDPGQISMSNPVNTQKFRIVVTAP